MLIFITYFYIFYISNKDESSLIPDPKNSQPNQLECMTEGTAEHVIPPIEYSKSIIYPH